MCVSSEICLYDLPCLFDLYFLLVTTKTWLWFVSHLGPSQHRMEGNLHSGPLDFLPHSP